MLIELDDIHKQYGRVRANDGISLRLEPGRIYGLLGENGAGKSTLMRVLAGHTRPDRGVIRFDGRSVARLTPALALQAGVGMLYQDPLDFPAMTVLENFMLGGPKRSKILAAERLEELARSHHFHLPPDHRVGELTVGERQQLEIVRLIEAGAKTLILDEPTTGISLPQKETLFATMRELSLENRIVIMVTHKLADAIDLCRELLIMRQGRLVGQLSPPYTSEDIVQKMFGREASEEAPDRVRPSLGQDPRIQVDRGRFVGDKYALSDVSVQIRPGEIIGLAGLEGNGQELLLRGLAGLVRMTTGKMILRGMEIQGRPYPFFLRQGIHFFPAARLEEALFPELSLSEHLCLAFPEQKGRLAELYQEECVNRFRLVAEPATSAGALSGGNQQRLLLSLIPAQTKLLLMEHPTRGLDMGSARQVWTHLEERCAQGASLVFSSADLDEILEHSHRVLVFFNREIAADLPIQEAGLEIIGGIMAGRHGKAA